MPMKHTGYTPGKEVLALMPPENLAHLAKIVSELCDRGAYAAACHAADPGALLSEASRLAARVERLEDYLSAALDFAEQGEVMGCKTMEEIRAALAEEECGRAADAERVGAKLTPDGCCSTCGTTGESALIADAPRLAARVERLQKRLDLFATALCPACAKKMTDLSAALAEEE